MSIIGLNSLWGLIGILHKMIEKIKSLFKLKLSHKIIILLVFIVFGSISIFSFFQIKKIEKDLINDAEKNHALLLTNALNLVAKSVWDFDLDVCANAITPLFDGGTVKKIQIFNTNGELFYGIEADKNKDSLIVLDPSKQNYEKLNLGKPSEYKQNYNDIPSKMISPIENFPNQEHRIVASLWWKDPLKKSPKFLGTMIMNFSTKYIGLRIQDQKMNFMLLSIGLSLIILILTFIFLQIQVISPIRRLMKASLDVSKGIFTKPKPLNNHDEIRNLTDNFNFMVDKIEANLQLEKDRANFERDLELTKSVQNTLLARGFPKSERYDIHTFYKSASQCGGDWYGVYELSPDKILILFGDVSGHGTPSALITAVTCGAADMLIQYMQNNKLNTENLPSRVLESLNKCIYLACRESYLMTMVAIYIDFQIEKMSISSAGQTPPAIIQLKDGKPSARLIYPPIGFRLGFKNDLRFETKTYDFHPSQKLFLYTDGIVEGENTEDQQYGNRNFKKSMENHFHKTPEEFLNAIADDFFQYSKGSPQADDITLLLLRFLKN